MTVDRSWRSALIGVVVSLALGALLAAALGYPVTDMFAALWRSSVVKPGKLEATLANGVPLLLTGLSAAIAFAAGPVNLGQPGQVLMGALFAVTVGLYVHLPSLLEVPLLLGAGGLGGALWAGIAAFTKRRFGMDEFIVTLMLNEIGRLFADWAISSPLQDRKAGSVTTKAIASSGFVSRWGSVSFGVIIAAGCGLVLRRLVVGYEWKMMGQAPMFARLGGVDNNRNTSAVLLFTGALAGFAGAMLLMAGPHRFVKGLGGNYGWDGVMIAVVAVNALLGCVLYAVLFSALQTGAIGMELAADVPSEYVQILQAIVVLVTVAVRGVITSRVRTWQARRRARRPSRQTLS
jgi:general nucleoside transport system permease protein